MLVSRRPLLAAAGRRTSPPTSSRSGATIDDAAGEAFDKVARLLGLPFPGGPHIDRRPPGTASVGIDFPRGLTSRRDLERHRFDFSFSGLKTAVARWVEAREACGRAGPGRRRRGVASRRPSCDVLTRKAIDAAASRASSDLLIGGGVAANSRLRAMAEERATTRASGCGCPGRACAPTTARWWLPWAPRWSLEGRPASDLDLPADSSMPVTDVSA